MGRMIFLGFLMILPAISVRPASAADCQGEAWQKVEAGIDAGIDFKGAVAFLRDEAIAFDSYELADEVYEPRVKEYQSRGIAPGCSLFIGEWLPLQESEITCFPFTTETTEFTSIDFDAAGKFIGLKCSPVVGKTSCEDARKRVDADTRWTAKKAEGPQGSFGLPVPARTECAAVARLN